MVQVTTQEACQGYLNTTYNIRRHQLPDTHGMKAVTEITEIAISRKQNNFTLKNLFVIIRENEGSSTTKIFKVKSVIAGSTTLHIT